MATLADYIKGKRPAAFEARPLYVAEGDCLTFYFKDDDAYAERIDELLTVYRSAGTRELVGCQVKGVRYILKNLGTFGVEIRDGKVDLRVLFMAYAFTRKRIPAEIDELKNVAEQTNARFEVPDLLAA